MALNNLNSFCSTLKIFENFVAGLFRQPNTWKLELDNEEQRSEEALLLVAYLLTVFLSVIYLYKAHSAALLPPRILSRPELAHSAFQAACLHYYTICSLRFNPVLLSKTGHQLDPTKVLQKNCSHRSPEIIRKRTRDCVEHCIETIDNLRFWIGLETIDFEPFYIHINGLAQLTDK